MTATRMGRRHDTVRRVCVPRVIKPDCNRGIFTRMVCVLASARAPLTLWPASASSGWEPMGTCVSRSAPTNRLQDVPRQSTLRYCCTLRTPHSGRICIVTWTGRVGDHSTSLVSDSVPVCLPSRLACVRGSVATSGRVERKTQASQGLHGAREAARFLCQVQNVQFALDNLLGRSARTPG